MSGNIVRWCDTVLCEITGYDESTQVKQLNFYIVDIPESLRTKLENAVAEN